MIKAFNYVTTEKHIDLLISDIELNDAILMIKNNNSLSFIFDKYYIINNITSYNIKNDPILYKYKMVELSCDYKELNEIELRFKVEEIKND